ncbi:MAG: type I-G CRISPR-associated helicase/endonuclease Cas3g [Acetobacteraceae bacterium]
MTLIRDDFGGFFRAIHGDDPFAWQTRLLHDVIDRGWPPVIAAPTGAGKTAVLDIALFHLALEARNDCARRAPRRIVFAVDRRVIVDQAFQRAKKVRCALATTACGVVAEVAAALRNGTTDAPLHVEQLRGGMPREDDWARTPAQPTILCTTIDQLGSRLLFRGYGVSLSMAPIHAGLLGEDALIILDEAHLSDPFLETLKGVERHRDGLAPNGERPLALPWAMCALTATPPAHGEDRFCLTEPERSEPAIAVRLAAAKTAFLQICSAKPGSPEHASAIVAAAETLLPRCTRPGPAIAVIVNRVSLARRVCDELGRRNSAILLTGRARPIERDRLIAEFSERLIGKDAEPPSGLPVRPLFVVATQCIEAGADFDFDAMVTAIAPLDSLRQRLGRLNRRGARPAAQAIILAAREEVGRNADDPIYADRAKTAWEWLSARANLAPGDAFPSLEVGPDSFDALIAADPDHAASCEGVPRHAPWLRPADVRVFATPSPTPRPDPYLPLYLRGEIETSPEVSIVWRADCDRATPDTARMVLACLPPRASEALRVPIWAVRAWLVGRTDDAGDVSDTGWDRRQDESRSGGNEALRWRGPDNKESAWVHAGDLRPGDLIVVPSGYGGCDRFGWAPGDKGRVQDIADLAAEPYAARRFALRLHSSLWETGEDGIPWADFQAGLATAIEEKSNRAALDLLRGVAGLTQITRDRLEKFEKARRVEILTPYGVDDEGNPKGIVILAARGLKASDPPPPAASTEDEHSGVASPDGVTIAAHSRSVAQKALEFAAAIGLGSAVTKSIAFAARHHDDGKADPRFQAWLAGTNAPLESEPLAKSAGWRGAAIEAAARAAADVPAHWRHEVLSVRIAVEHLAEPGSEIDPDLALFLIGSHHGQGRPFFVHDDPWDSQPRTVSGVHLGAAPGPQGLDFDWRGKDWAELFASLQTRYGIWGLAFLEAVLRLADHRVSEAP